MTERTPIKRVLERTQLKRRVNAAQYVNTWFRGLECLGSFTTDFGDRKAYHELYKIPGRRGDFGIIGNDGLCQLHPKIWHQDRKLKPVTGHPLNTRIQLSPPDARGVVKVKILDKPKAERRVLRRKRIYRRSDE